MSEVKEVILFEVFHDSVLISLESLFKPSIHTPDEFPIPSSIELIECHSYIIYSLQNRTIEWRQQSLILDVLYHFSMEITMILTNKSISFLKQKIRSFLLERILLAIIMDSIILHSCDACKCYEASFFILLDSKTIKK